MKKMAIFKLVLFIVLFYLILYEGIWMWGFCRFYVPYGYMAIITSKRGAPLKPGQILANPGQKGILKTPLGEGRHFYNPIFYTYEIRPLVKIRPGYIGIVTSKVGKPLPPGQILADKGYKGIQKQILPPGTYRINPYGYEIQEVPAVFIKPGTVGVVTNLAGRIPRKQKLLAEKGERGLQKYVLQPGLYYLNPHEFKVEPVRIGTNQISNWGKDIIGFPSRDGFIIHVDTTIEWKLLPGNAPEIIARFGNVKAVVEKIIKPQLLSICRIEGSKYLAKNFIIGEERELFQKSFTQHLKEVCKEKNIEIERALIRGIMVPEEVAHPIKEKFIAIEEDLTNKEKQITAKIGAELEKQKALIVQNREKVKAETEAIIKQIEAEAQKEAETIMAKTQIELAEMDKKIAVIEAKKKRAIGKAEATVTQLIGEANGTTYKLLVEAFGSGEIYNYYTFAQALPYNLNLSLIYAGDGTLWTDLKSAANLAGMENLRTMQRTKKRMSRKYQGSKRKIDASKYLQKWLK